MPTMTLKEPTDTIFNYRDFLLGQVTWLDDTERAAVENVSEWVQRFLFNPHPELGRSGVVCPFAEPAMRKNVFWFTLYRGQRPDGGQVVERMRHNREAFLELVPGKPRDDGYKTLLTVFPDLPLEEAPVLIDGVQRVLKQEFVAQSLMFGQFHLLCQEPGLHNQDFRPLQAPVPMLVIRHMVSSDIPFLKDDPALVEKYLQYFKGRVPPMWRPMVQEVAAAYGLDGP